MHGPQNIHCITFLFHVLVVVVGGAVATAAAVSVCKRPSLPVSLVGFGSLSSFGQFVWLGFDIAVDILTIFTRRARILLIWISFDIKHIYWLHFEYAHKHTHTGYAVRTVERCHIRCTLKSSTSSITIAHTTIIHCTHSIQISSNHPSHSHPDRGIGRPACSYRNVEAAGCWFRCLLFAA